MSGWAVSRVYSSRLTSSTGIPSRGSVPMTRVMSSPVSSSARRDVGDVAVVVDARPLDQPEHVADGLAVEGDRPGHAQALRQHLDVGPDLAHGRHHHLDHAATLVGRRVDDHRARFGHGASHGVASASSARPWPMWRASA